MADEFKADEYKSKFRPDQTALDQEVEAALGGVSLDDLYGFDKPQGDAQQGGEGQAPRRRAARGAGGSSRSTRTTRSSTSAARARASAR